MSSGKRKTDPKHFTSPFPKLARIPWQETHLKSWSTILTLCLSFFPEAIPCVVKEGTQQQLGIFSCAHRLTMESQLEALLLQAQALEKDVNTMLSESQLVEERHLLSKASQLFDSGDTAWMMFATILVYLMTTPGIMLYYAGFVRVQNVLSTAMQGFSLACLITFLWLCFGYSLSFSPTNDSNPAARVFGTTERFWLLGMHPDSAHQNAPTIPEPLFCAFQLAFAVITPSLICGAFADRMKFSSMLISLGLWHLVVYCPIAHSHWHPDGFLHRIGAIDYAGGNVVHVSAGFSSLVSALIIGQRSGFGKSNFHPHNLLVSITGPVPSLPPSLVSLIPVPGFQVLASCGLGGMGLMRALAFAPMNKLASRCSTP
jgi:hypothetical protein